MISEDVALNFAAASVGVGAGTTADLLFAINQAASTASDALVDDQSWIYLFRLSGYVLILVAILSTARRAEDYASRQSA